MSPYFSISGSFKHDMALSSAYITYIDEDNNAIKVAVV